MGYAKKSTKFQHHESNALTARNRSSGAGTMNPEKPRLARGFFVLSSYLPPDDGTSHRMPGQMHLPDLGLAGSPFFPY